MVKYKYFLWHMEETSTSHICTSTSTHSCSGSRSSSRSISCCISSNPCINITIPEHLMILLSDWLTAVLPLTCTCRGLSSLNSTHWPDWTDCVPLQWWQPICSQLVTLRSDFLFSAFGSDLMSCQDSSLSADTQILDCHVFYLVLSCHATLYLFNFTALHVCDQVQIQLFQEAHELHPHTVCSTFTCSIFTSGTLSILWC